MLNYSHEFLVSGSDGVRTPFKQQKFLVIGHRGSGMNMHLKLKEIEENSMLSFNEAGKSGVDFVEFDVQVSDGVTVSDFKVKVTFAFLVVRVAVQCKCLTFFSCCAITNQSNRAFGIIRRQ